MVKVALVSSEGKVFQVEEEVLKQSKFIKNIIQDSGTQQKISFPKISTKILQKVVNYFQHYENRFPKEIARPLLSNTLVGVVDEWDVQFINLQPEELLQLILAADYLQIQSLKKLGAAQVATKIKGKNTQQLRILLGIANDYTPQDETKIRQQCAWMVQKEKKEKKGSNKQKMYGEYSSESSGYNIDINQSLRSISDGNSANSVQDEYDIPIFPQENDNQNNQNEQKEQNKQNEDQK